jgi:predicted acylesterase/phospholipase RssA
MPRGRSRPASRSIGLALAGGGPFGAVYEIGALLALEDAVQGLELHRLDCYVGVSAGSFLAAALANGIPIREIHRVLIGGGAGDIALSANRFRRPAWREYLRATLGRRLPTGIFDNEAIHHYLSEVFERPGRTNDFRRLGRRLYIVATDLDTGETVSFGRPGHDHVPISRAVQASAALPGIFPPVQIEGHHFVDGALRKTLHASEALDDGMGLVLCVNPIVPFDRRRAAAGPGRPRPRLARAGLTAVMSQTLRTLIHSRLVTGIARYRTRYPGADVVLFEPEQGDEEIFSANLLGYAARRRICERAYRSTLRDLLRRRERLEPVFARHGVRIRPTLLTPEEGAAATPLTVTAVRLDASLAQLRGLLEGKRRHGLA